MDRTEVELVSSEAEVVHPEAELEQREVEQMFPELVIEHLREVPVLPELAEAEPEFMQSAKSRQRPFPMQLPISYFILVLLYLCLLIVKPHTVLYHRV